MNAYLKWSAKDAPNAVTGPFPDLATLSQYVDVSIMSDSSWESTTSALALTSPYGNPPDYTGTHFPIPHHSCFLPRCSTIRTTLEYVENFNRVKDLPLLRAELVRHGYSSVDIAKIFGGNWMRVFGQAWNS